MNDIFLITAVVYVLLQSFLIGYSWWRECVKTGYNPKHYERTGEKVQFHGGFFEGLLNLPMSTLVALISPKIILMRLFEIILAFAIYAIFSRYELFFSSPIIIFSVFFVASIWPKNKIKPWPAKKM